MRTITTIGLDIAKSVFQVHGGAQRLIRHENLRILAGRLRFEFSENYDQPGGDERNQPLSLRRP